MVTETPVVPVPEQVPATPKEKVHLGMTWDEIKQFFQEYSIKANNQTMLAELRKVRGILHANRDGGIGMVYQLLGLYNMRCEHPSLQETRNAIYGDFINDVEDAIRVFYIAMQKKDTDTEKFLDNSDQAAGSLATDLTILFNPVGSADAMRRKIHLVWRLVNPGADVPSTFYNSASDIRYTFSTAFNELIVNFSKHNWNKLHFNRSTGVVTICDFVRVINHKDDAGVSAVPVDTFKKNKRHLQIDFDSVPDLVAKPKGSPVYLDVDGCREVIVSDRFQNVIDATILGFKHHDRDNSKQDDLYIGLEWECNQEDIEPSFNTFTADMMQALGYDYGITKMDGSVSGFELNSCPATYEVHMQRWQALKDSRVMERSGVPYIATNKTGIHMHLSRSAFTPEHAARFFCAFNHQHNKNFIVWVAGRNLESTSGTNWAAFDANRRLNEVKNVHDKGALPSQQKYSAVNTLHSSTYEVRLFKTRTNVDEMFMLFDFMKSFYEFTKQTTDEHIFVEDYAKFLFKDTKDNEYIHIKKALIAKTKKEKANDVLSALKEQGLSVGKFTSKQIAKAVAVATGATNKTKQEQERTSCEPELMTNMTACLSFLKMMAESIPTVYAQNNFFGGQLQALNSSSADDGILRVKLLPRAYYDGLYFSKDIPIVIKYLDECLVVYNDLVGMHKLMLSKFKKAGMDNETFSNQGYKNSWINFFSKSEGFRDRFKQALNYLDRVVKTHELPEATTAELKAKFEERVRLTKDLTPETFDKATHKIPPRIKANSCVEIDSMIGLKVYYHVIDNLDSSLPLALVSRYKYLRAEPDVQQDQF